MSIDVTFKPIGVTALVPASTATVQVVDKGAYLGATTFRVRCVIAGYLNWGQQSTLGAAVAPSAGTPSQNTIGMAAGAVAYLEVPASSYFRGDGTATFELTPGTGGTGG